MPPLPQNGNNHGDPYYTNEDVAILHTIVVRAQDELSELPERDRRNTVALFHVYDEILPTLGIDAAHDNRYAPILFKIGGMLGEATLYEKFEAVLGRLGIEIELDDRSGSISENAQETEFEPESLFDPDSLAVGAPTPHPERRRRYSESAIEITEGRGPNGHTATRSYSAGSVSNTHIGGDYAERSVSKQDLLSSKAPDAVPQAEAQDVQITQPPRLISRQENGAGSSSNQRVRIRRYSHSTYENGSEHPTISSSPPPSAEYVDASQAITHSGVQLDETGASTPDNPPGPTLHLPETFLDMRAQLFYQRQTAIRATDIFRVWRSELQRLSGLHALADNHDWKFLIYGSFKAWRSKTASSVVNRYRIAQEQAEQERREQEEAELQHQLEERDRYLQDLEEEAAAARDQFFVRKILSRWSQNAAAEIEQSLAARRQVLGRRYFNAWRDLTVANEEKVQHHILKKFLRKWREKSAQNSGNHELAINRYEENLVQQQLWEWWGRYGTVILSRRRDANVQRKCLTIWLGSVLDVEEREHMATLYRRDQLVRKVWTIWRARTRQKRAITQAKLDQLQLRTDQRLVRQNFIIWLWLSKKKMERRNRSAQASLERRQKEAQAVSYYRLQVLKEALSTWRYRLRSELVVDRVNRNSASQTMYKWVLESRLQQFRSIKDARLKQSTLQLLIQKRRAVVPLRLQNERIAEEHAAKRSKNVMLRHWLLQMKNSSRREKEATQAYVPRLLHKQLQKWKTKLQVVRRHQGWARDAEFFLATTKSVKLWKAAKEKSKQERNQASEAAKRERLYSAYTLVRRKHKMRLAENVIHTWREKADAVTRNNGLAFQVRQNHATILGMEIFDRWRAQTEDLIELDALAPTQYQETILKSSLRRWREKLHGVESMQDDASGFREKHLYAVCGQLIKTWSRRGFHIRAKDNQIMANEKTAEEYHERCIRAAFRKNLKKWRQKTLEIRQLRGSALGIEPPGSMARRSAYSTPGKPRNPRTTPFTPNFPSASRSEGWNGSDYDDDQGTVDDVELYDPAHEFNPNLDTPVPTPINSILRTPMRKSSGGILNSLAHRASTAASTTPRTPLATPFERRLRDEYEGQKSFPRQGSGLGLGKSGLGKSVGFKDLPDLGDKGKGRRGDHV